MKNAKSTHSRGFTLLELLVVITIVIAIAALSLVGLTRMRAAGDRTTTIAVMRQLQMANMGYANEHNGQFVPLTARDDNGATINDWHENSTFLAYLTGDTSDVDNNLLKTKKVPESILDPLVVRSKKRYWDKLFASYGYNEVAMPGTTNKSFRTSQLTDPTRTACFVTATDWIVKYSGRLLWESNPVEGKSSDGKIAFRHSNKAIVVYYDGSSGLISPNDIRRFDENKGINNPFWKANH